MDSDPGLNTCLLLTIFRPDGHIVDSGAKPGKAAILYSTSFTRKYAEIARVSPLFAQMRNQIDMLVAAAYIRNEDFYGQAGWHAETLLDEAELPAETLPKPQRVQCVVNTIWKRNRLEWAVLLRDVTTSA